MKAADLGASIRAARGRVILFQGQSTALLFEARLAHWGQLIFPA